MRMSAYLAALMSAGLIALSVLPTAAAAPQQPPSDGQPAQQDTPAERLRARREQLQRRQEAVRQRQDEARRARLAARQGPMASEPFMQTVKIGREGTLSLVNLSGNVTITGGSGDDVRIQATRRVWDHTVEDAKALLPQVQIDVTEHAGGVDVRTTFPRPRALDAEVELTVAVPAGASVSVRAGSGDVTVTGVRGEVRAEAVGGAITASSLGQVRLLRTLSGPIRLESAESTDVTVSTLGGAVTIQQLKAHAADLRSVGGDLTVIDSDSDRVNAQSLTGRIELTGHLARTGRYTLQSQSGDVRLTPIGTDGFEVEATAVNGTVRSDYPLAVNEHRAAAVAAQTVPGGRGSRGGRGGARVLRGVSGSGGPLVTLRSFSGDISITRR